MEVKKDGIEGEIIDELKKLREEMELLKEKMGWMEPVVK